MRYALFLSWSTVLHDIIFLFFYIALLRQSSIAFSLGKWAPKSFSIFKNYYLHCDSRHELKIWFFVIALGNYLDLINLLIKFTCSYIRYSFWHVITFSMHLAVLTFIIVISLPNSFLYWNVESNPIIPTLTCSLANFSIIFFCMLLNELTEPNCSKIKGFGLLFFIFFINDLRLHKWLCLLHLV